MKKALKGMAIILLFFAAVVVGLTAGIVELSKESEVGDDDVMRSKSSGEAVQCANTDIVVSDGMLTSRVVVKPGTRARRALSAADSAVATRRAYIPHALSSTMPERYFKELEWLELQSTTSATLSLKIMGIVRIPSVKVC